MNQTMTTKATYTKPTLVEYGSLAERTKMFGLPEADPDFLICFGGICISIH
jgi:hypothetical protein